MGWQAGWTSPTGKSWSRLRAAWRRDTLVSADRSGAVAVEVLKLGDDVLPDPFAGHFLSVLLAEVLLQSVYEFVLIDGSYVVLARRTFDG
jgi:hypothetical protein